MADASVVPVSQLQCSCFCQDILVPFILDSRMPDDTLYWICEEDFRFWPPGKDPDYADTYERDVDDLIEKREMEGGSVGSSLPPSQGRQKGAAGQKRVETEFHTAHTQGCSDETVEDCGFCRDVIDVVRIATMCHRHHMGNIIWLSWCPNKGKPSRIGHGSQCILMTRAGMLAVNEAKEKGELKRGHIDLELQAWLLKNRNAEEARASYIYPPIGSYTEHPSECDPAQFGGDKTRPSGFNSGENPCHGTREWSDPKQRAKAILQWRPG